MVIGARAIAALAGTMGFAGVGLAAAGSHLDGGDLARTAASFLSIHGAVVLGLGLGVLQGLRPAGLWLTAAGVLAAGTIVFAADLALIALRQWRPVPLAAPVGGGLMLAGWLLVIAVAVVARNSGLRGRN